MSKEILKALPVQFQGDTIYAVSIEQRPYVVIKSICEAIGMDSDRVVQSIKTDEILSAELRVAVVQVGEKQSRNMAVLSVDYIQGWLFSIQVAKVAERYRQKLIEYKKLCHIILNSYFNGDIKTILEHHARGTALRQEMKTLNARIAEIKKELTEMSDFAEEYYGAKQTALVFDI